MSFEIAPAEPDAPAAAAFHSSSARKKAKTAKTATRASAATREGSDSEEQGSDRDGDSDGDGGGSQLWLPKRHDERRYDSDHEEYDAQDRTRTLALATMMLRHSKRKALVDASYNRYAWNDPSALPSWFLDDEMRHNKPQVPVPKALVDQVSLFSI